MSLLSLLKILKMQCFLPCSRPSPSSELTIWKNNIVKKKWSKKCQIHETVTINSDSSEVWIWNFDLLFSSSFLLNSLIYKKLIFFALPMLFFFFLLLFLVVFYFLLYSIDLKIYYLSHSVFYWSRNCLWCLRFDTVFLSIVTASSTRIKMLFHIVPFLEFDADSVLTACRNSAF